MVFRGSDLPSHLRGRTDLFANVEYIERLIKRLQLQDTPLVSLPFVVSRWIQPVTQVDALLQEYLIKKETKDISAAAGTNIDYFEVPDGERWRIDGLFRDDTTAATKPFFSDGTNPMFCQPSQTGALYSTPQVWCDEGWTIGLVTTGNGGDSSRALYVAITKEVAY